MENDSVLVKQQIISVEDLRPLAVDTDQSGVSNSLFEISPCVQKDC